MSGNTLEIFGRRLQQARLRMGTTQEELAEQMDVAPITVHYWERGRFMPQAYRLPELAFYTGTTIDWLLGYNPESEPEAARPGCAFFRNQEEVLPCIQAIPLQCSHCGALFITLFKGEPGTVDYCPRCGAVRVKEV